MLKTLKNYDRKKSERVLSILTSRLLPDPAVESERHQLEIDTELHNKVLDEIYHRLKINPSELEPSIRARLFEFLFNEMSQLALTKTSLMSVKTRLADRGELRPDLFDVKFNDWFNISEAHGVRRNHVLEAIKNADDFEHLNLFDESVRLSFFLRTHSELAREDRFSLLVFAERRGASLIVNFAWRIYHSDVDLSGAQRPLDVLRLLANKYGFNLTIGHLTSKFIFNEIVNIEPPLNPKKVVKVNALEGENIYGVVRLVKGLLYNSINIALALALDQYRYAVDLQKHGVHVQTVNLQEPALFPA